MPVVRPLPYLSEYPADVLRQVRKLIATDSLGRWLLERYPNPAVVTNDKTLTQYVMVLKNDHFKTAPPLRKICFDDKTCAVHRSLGLHTFAARVQGRKLKCSNEIRIASLFKETPPQFLRLVVVHELAHLREIEHNKAFFQLCCRVEPNYFEYDFGLRLYLTHRDIANEDPELKTAR